MIPLHDSVPTRSFPLVTVTIIALNVAIWLAYQVPNLERSVVELGFYPCEVRGSCRERGEAWPINAVTAMFLHGGWFHIIGNMIFLWVFGNNVEDAMGRIRFLAFYLLSGFAATALQAYVTLAFGSPAETEIPNVGASGAIAGVLGAYFVLFPYAQVVAVVPLLFVLLPVRVPAVVFLGLWFVFQLWQGSFSLVAPLTGGGIAFFAHIGGFVFGMLAVRLFADRRRPQIAGPW